MVTHDAGAALRAATAAAVAQTLGRSFRVPYFRAAGGAVTADSTLVAMVRSELRDLSVSELEQHIKRWMWVEGAPMSFATPELTPDDRMRMQAAMRARGFTSSDRESLAQFAFDLWLTLDYGAGARRVRDRIAEAGRAAPAPASTSAAARTVPHSSPKHRVIKPKKKPSVRPPARKPERKTRCGC